MGVLTSSYAGILTIIIMLMVGSTIRISDVVENLRKPRGLIVGLAGQMLLIPAIGFALAATLGGTSCMALAIVAVVPGGVTSTILTAAARGNTALSAMLTFLSNLLVVVWVPLLLGLVPRICGVDALAPGLDFAALAVRLALVSAVPLLTGMALVALFPRFMGRIQPYLVPFAAIVFLIIVFWILWDDRANLAGYVTGAGILVPALMLLCGAGAWLVAGLASLGAPTRIALVFEWSVQNIPMAILVAQTLGDVTTMALPSAAYGLQQMVLGLLVLILVRRIPRLRA